MENIKPTRLSGIVQKGWGYELIWVSNEKYCSKIMVFEKANTCTSMFFHKEKDKTWFVNAGKFSIQWVDTTTAAHHKKELKEGDVWNTPPLQPHQLTCLQDNSSITEVSTADSVEDNYHISPGND